VQTLHMPVEQAAVSGGEVVTIKIEGLTGGHSGVDIMMGGANAVKVCRLQGKRRPYAIVPFSCFDRRKPDVSCSYSNSYQRVPTEPKEAILNVWPLVADIPPESLVSASTTFI
jgi:hypothetical protein